MSEKERKIVNKEHPDYPEYLQRYNVLRDAFDEKVETEKAKYPKWRGLDHPAYRDLRETYRQFHREVYALQKEFAYLFVDRPEEPNHED